MCTNDSPRSAMSDLVPLGFRCSGVISGKFSLKCTACLWGFLSSTGLSGMGFIVLFMRLNCSRCVPSPRVWLVYTDLYWSGIAVPPIKGSSLWSPWPQSILFTFVNSFLDSAPMIPFSVWTRLLLWLECPVACFRANLFLSTRPYRRQPKINIRYSYKYL